MRVFSGVILGYLLFRLLWVGLFRVTNTDPHAPASISFQLGAIVFGLMFALLAGYAASFIGGRPDFIAAWVVGALVATGALYMMAKDGISWAPGATLLFMAPAAVVGGWSYVLRARSKTDSGSKP
jgi:fructose-specific phosphotransferase system IIC component